MPLPDEGDLTVPIGVGSDQFESLASDRPFICANDPEAVERDLKERTGVAGPPSSGRKRHYPGTRTGDVPF
jgi:hypothetical protein